jgi:hypothetical protein
MTYSLSDLDMAHLGVGYLSCGFDVLCIGFPVAHTRDQDLTDQIFSTSAYYRDDIAN